MSETPPASSASKLILRGAKELQQHNKVLMRKVDELGDKCAKLELQKEQLVEENKWLRQIVSDYAAIFRG